MQTTNLVEFLEFMRERHEIYIRQKVQKRPPPWTDDPVLRSYRFCNVYRELDTVTIWIRENIREPYADHANLWFMLALARQINHPDTLAEIINEGKGAWPTNPDLTKWKPHRARDIMLARKARGEQVYTGAYMLTNVFSKGDVRPARDKPFYTCHRVMASLVRLRDSVDSAAHASMGEFHAAIRRGEGFGGFLSYEVACDLRWTRYGDGWKDINTFAFAGPGAVRGLNRVEGVPYKNARPEEEALADMRFLLTEARKAWPRRSTLYPTLELREIEHSLCEYDKWKRTHNGEGRPRSKYTPSPT